MQQLSYEPPFTLHILLYHSCRDLCSYCRSRRLQVGFQFAVVLSALSYMIFKLSDENAGSKKQGSFVPSSIRQNVSFRSPKKVTKRSCWI